ncbi:unnamed protein product [Anisakis simplex]|uniref:MFS domain-containing protein n=1 Tax=Anisakis simplex TaxID=6269 RepID=A0A0M3JRG2_ANISI|nr:unnamed protein product [Anisakis simplex]
MTETNLDTSPEKLANIKRVSIKNSARIRISKRVSSIRPKPANALNVSGRDFQVLERVNPFGTFQIFACICILFATIEWAGNYTFVSVLGSIEPDWSCETKHNRTVVIKAPTDEAQCQFIKANCTKLTAIKSSVEFYSLVAQWKSICDESDRPKLVQLIQSIGGFIGSFVGGHFGDHFGRKKFFFTGQLCVVITSVMATATTSWYTYSICLGLNAILYGSIEVRFASHSRQIITQLAIYNELTSPIIVGFMLFYESPRWLVASNQLERACEVLNDIAHRRWNNANIKLTTNDLNLIPRDTTNKRPFYNVYHLFCTRRLFKQTFMQLLSMFTYGLISSTYFFSKKGMHDSAIMFTFLHGAFRIAVPPLVVFLDFKFYNFGRKMQLVGSLGKPISTVCFAIVIVLILLHVPYYHTAVTICIVIASMANESVFWMNIVQITSQRYPTVIRCIAFGCIHAFKHVGMIIGVWIMIPLLSINPLWTFIIPEIFIIVTMLCGIALQPETKGKVLTDRLIESHFGRLQNEIPKAIMR